MLKREATERSHVAADLPQVLVVEVMARPDPDGHPILARLAGLRDRAPRAVVVALAVALSVMAAVQWWPGTGRTRGPLSNLSAHEIGRAGVAAAYGYPLECLSITFLAGDPTYARADFNHLTRCGRYTGYPTAIFHYSRGRWRPVLDAIAYTCPIGWLPPNVQKGLDVCTPTSRARRAVKDRRREAK